jgi:RHS repeat-associated protein
MGYVTVQSFVDGELTKEVDASGTSAQATTSYGYYANTAGAKLVTDPDGHVWIYIYDQNGNLLRKTNPLGDSWTYAYNPLNEQVAATTPLGGTTISSFNSAGDLTGTIAPEPNGTVSTTSEAYTDSSNPGLVTAFTNANSKTTNYTYDSHGDLASVTDPLGNETTYAYNAIGEKTSMVSPRGNVSGCGCASSFTTDYYYDGYGNLKETTDPLGHSTYATYDGIGDELTSTDQNGEVTTYNYDGDKELVDSYLQGGSCTPTRLYCTSYTYNADGDKVSMEDAKSYTTTYGYDQLNRLTSTTDPLTHATSTTYDAAGNVLTTTDQDSDVTHYTYNAANELAAEAEPGGSCTGTVSYCLTYTYDADGNKTSYTDANGDLTTYTYNFLDQLTATTDGLSNTTSYTYDPVGNLLTEENPDSKTTTWTYNGDNEVSNVAYSDGVTHSIAYTYTPDSKLWTMIDASGTSTYTYDDADRLSSYENGASVIVGYGYDSAGNVTSLTYPGSHVLTEHYNSLEELDYVKDWNSEETQFGYDADGNPTTITYPNGITSTTAYDNADRLSSITDTLSSTTVESFTYGRDDAGYVTSETDVGTPGAGSVTDGYNSLHQLTSSGTHSYSYSTANNLTTSPSGKTLAYNADDEPCWSASTSAACSSPPTGATTYTYSKEGNRTATTPSSGTSDTYAYNEANEMTSVTPSGGTATTYVYDGNGLLESQTTGSSTTQLTWNPEPALPALLSDGTNDYIYGPSATPVEQIGVSSGTTSYLLSDELGSIRGITNSSGTVTGSESYDPWGNVTGTSGTISTSLGFAGGYTDAKSGFVYFRARFYDPATGAFTTLDPKVASTLAPFVYANDGPLNFTDLTGLLSFGSVFHSVVHHLDDARHDVAATAKATVKVVKKVAPYVAVGATFLATLPLDETGAGEALDATVATEELGEGAAAESESSAAEESATVCGGQSFTATTEVRLADGKNIPIDHMKVGMTVLATNVNTGKNSPERVDAVLVNDDHDLLTLDVKVGTEPLTIHTTQHHLFYDETTKSWVQAGHLTAGDELATPDNSSVNVIGTTTVPGSGAMWDLTVANDHDFYVVVSGGSSAAVLVHNCGDDPMDHIMERHGPGTEGNGAGTFSQGTSPDDIQSMIEDTVQNGASRANTGGRAGQIFEQTFGSPIGTNGSGAVSSSLRVVLNGDGGLTTAFPY